jgi:restriction system protein
MVPDYQTFMLPLLRLAGDGKERSVAETRDALAAEFQLAESDLQQMLPSGQQTMFANRVAWAKQYLTQAGLLVSTRRGYYVITNKGRQVLASSPKRVDVRFLDQFPEFRDFRVRRRVDEPDDGSVESSNEGDETPEELLETAYARIRGSLASELLTRVKAGSPGFFERLVVELLVKMGYGGSRREAGRAIGRAGDEGIDGVISEDRLGLEVVYIQAKKWEGTVGRPEIHKFVGALHGKRARKGVFITTSSFTSEAIAYVEHIDPKIVLIDGRLLAELMMDFDVGVTPVATYQLKRVDSDYFSEE